jgi:hypothetical protein
MGYHSYWAPDPGNICDIVSINIPRILLIVVNFLPVDVTVRGPNLQALKFLGGVGSATTRRIVLGGGLLSERAGSWPLSKILRVSGGTLARARATCLLALLGTPLMTFTSHCLQEREWNKSESMIGMLGRRYKSPMKKP